LTKQRVLVSTLHYDVLCPRVFLQGLGNKPSKESNALIGKSVQVGQYQLRVESLLGEGGFASIYRVRDVATGAPFALKHLRLQADADAIKEVQHEAKVMAKLRGHPNILRMHTVAFAGPKVRDWVYAQALCAAAGG
jgi:serine/threonine protein kinase